MGNIPTLLNQLIYCPRRKWLKRAVVGMTFACLSATISLRFYWEPRWNLGTVVYTDIRVPATTETIDLEATRQAKESIRWQTPQIYRVDLDANTSAMKHLEELLAIADLTRKLNGQIPYLSSAMLSDEVQLYLRRLPETDWQNLNKYLSTVDREQLSDELTRLSLLKKPIESKIARQSISELLNRQSELSSADYAKLIDAIAQARQRYGRALAKLNEGPEVFRSYLLEVSDADWEKDKYAARQSLDDLLSFGLVPGLPEEMRRHRLEKLQNLPKDAKRRDMVLGLLNTVIMPNLQPDYLATAQQAERAAETIKKTMTLHAGQVIVAAGQQITKEQFELLDRLGLTERRTNWGGIAAVTIGVAIATLLLVQIYQRWSRWLKFDLKARDIVAIGLTVTGTALASVLLTTSNMMAFLPLATTGLVVGSFYGRRLATLITLLLAVPLAIPFSLGAGVGIAISYLPILVGASLGAILTDRPHTRSRIALVGLAVAGAQFVTYAVIAIATGTAPMAVLAVAFQYAAGGLISSVAALGAIPYLEQICYTLTPIRLAELANLDRPLLRLLVTEAPGTFQHTLFVANLAEAAARELGADTALVRTGTLYHDIGKTLKPEYFIENQMGQQNPHDVLDDPWRSAQIIKEHVTGGLKLAQKHRLPQLLQTFIPEHQGTITISYFYHKAKACSLDVRESDFRYAGPIPQSRETGIVMLADACEAALRSLGSDTTLEEAESMVLRIFQARWDDGQLDDAGLTPEDLDKIARVFIKVWQERNHGRIKYPPLAQKLDPTGSSLPGQSLTEPNINLKTLETTAQLEKR